MPTATERLQIKALGRDIDQLTERAVVRVTLNVEDELKRANPVDTGWSRANWIPSVGQPVEGAAGSPDNVSPAESAQSSGESSVLAYALRRGKAFISNNVRYVLSLNARGARHAFNSNGRIEDSEWVQRAVEKGVRDTRV